MSETFLETVEELQKRVDMLHVLAGVEVSEIALGYAVGFMQGAMTTLDHAADHIVSSSGMTSEEWREYRDAEGERERLAKQREKARAQRERRKEREERRKTDASGSPSEDSE